MRNLEMTIKIKVKTFGPIKKDDPEYIALRERLKSYKRFRVWDTSSHETHVKAGTYHVETDHLFDNQSNTKEGFRIFDFADYSRNPHVANTRYGHYIENIDELEAARAKRSKCGYCGHSEDDADGEWCPKCRGSEYLEPSNYRLLQMLPVSSRAKRDAEPPADVIADIEKQQMAGAKLRAEKKIAAKIAKLEQDQLNAAHEIEFIRACVELGFHTTLLDNLIYYSHTNKFCFGWRKPIANTVASDIERRFKAADLWHMYDVTFKTNSIGKGG